MCQGRTRYQTFGKVVDEIIHKNDRRLRTSRMPGLICRSWIVITVSNIWKKDKQHQSPFSIRYACMHILLAYSYTIRAISKKNVDCKFNHISFTHTVCLRCQSFRIRFGGSHDNIEGFCDRRDVAKSHRISSTHIKGEGAITLNKDCIATELGFQPSRKTLINQ